MQRILFHVIAGVSLFLFLAASALWLRSHRTRDLLTFESEKIVGVQARMMNFDLDSSQGELLLIFGMGRGRANPSAEFSWYRHNSGPPSRIRMEIDEEPTLLHQLGFRVSLRKANYSYQNGIGTAVWFWKSQLSTPYWFLAAVFFVFPAFKFFRKQSQHMAGGNLCAKCEYDLRAAPDRCPECGTVTVRELPHH